MRQRTALYTILAAMLLAGPALAQGPGDEVAAQLKRMGYDEVTISHTLLGRLRIVAIGSDFRREIVLDPRNGEILRDLRTSLVDQAVTIEIPDDHGLTGSGGGSGSGGTGSGGTGSGGTGSGGSGSGGSGSGGSGSGGSGSGGSGSGGSGSGGSADDGSSDDDSSDDDSSDD